MEAIQPCPLPDQSLTMEIKRLNKHVEFIERTFTEELQSYKKIIEVLQNEFESSKLRNKKLSNDI